VSPFKKGGTEGGFGGARRIFALKKSLFHLPCWERMEGEGGCAGDNLPLIPS